MIVITGYADEFLFDDLFEIGRSGHTVTLILASFGGNIRKLHPQARQLGVLFYILKNEKSPETWGLK